MNDINPILVAKGLGGARLRLFQNSFLSVHTIPYTIGVCVTSPG